MIHTTARRRNARAGFSASSSRRTFRANRPFLSVADRHQAVGGNAQLHQKIACGGRAAVAQAEVIFGRAPLVAVPFHVDFGVGEIGENPLQRLGVGASAPRARRRECCWNRNRRAHPEDRIGRATSSVLRSLRVVLVFGGGGGAGAVTVTVAVADASPPGPLAVRTYDVVCCGVIRCVPVGGTVPEAIADRDIVRPGHVPAQHGGLAALDRRKVRRKIPRSPACRSPRADSARRRSPRARAEVVEESASACCRPTAKTIRSSRNVSAHRPARAPRERVNVNGE